jgi:hypothetical protein
MVHYRHMWRPSIERFLLEIINNNFKESMQIKVNAINGQT